MHAHTPAELTRHAWEQYAVTRKTPFHLFEIGSFRLCVKCQGKYAFIYIARN